MGKKKATAKNYHQTSNKTTRKITRVQQKIFFNFKKNCKRYYYKNLKKKKKKKKKKIR